VVSRPRTVGPDGPLSGDEARDAMTAWSGVYAHAQAAYRMLATRELSARADALADVDEALAQLGKLRAALAGP
jgi:hypothetical protein